MQLPKILIGIIASFSENPEAILLDKFCGNIGYKSVDAHGNTYRNGLLHSYNDQPAHTDSEKTLRWYKNGKLHRETVDEKNTNPAVIYVDRTLQWYMHGKLHKQEESPTIIHNRGVACIEKFWIKDEKIHRNGDFPARVVEKMASESLKRTRMIWCKNGKWGRDFDLPAYVELSSDAKHGLKEWFRDGKFDYHRIVDGGLLPWAIQLQNGVISSTWTIDTNYIEIFIENGVHKRILTWGGDEPATYEDMVLRTFKNGRQGYELNGNRLYLDLENSTFF